MDATRAWSAGEAAAHARGVVTDDERYQTFLALSGVGIARFEMDPPVDTAAPEDQQVERIVRHGRIAECNESFAELYGRRAADLVGLAIPDLRPSRAEAPVEGVRQFVRAAYRLVEGEEVHALDDGSTRYVSGSALGVLRNGFLVSYWLTLSDVSARRRAERDREVRGRILEAVAFGAARLLAPGRWEEHANEVLEKLGTAAEAARVYIGRTSRGPGEDIHASFEFAWEDPGVEQLFEGFRARGGLSLQSAGILRLGQELRAGRAVCTLVSTLRSDERTFLEQIGSKALAVLPIFVEGEWWGFLGFGESRFEREWSGPELEALKAAAAMFGAAIERERADDDLHEGEERFERLAAAAFEGIAISEGGVFVDANEQLARMMQTEVPALVGRRVEEFVAEGDREEVRRRVLAGDEGPYQHLAQRQDGSSFPVEVRARSLPYRGRTVRVSAVRDVSERVMAEERQRVLEAELRHAADEWRRTFDALDLGIVLADGDGKILRLNRGALELASGPGFEEVLGRRIHELQKGEPWRTAVALHRGVVESRATRVAETRDASSGRSFYLLASPWSRAENESPSVVVTFRDVTEFTAMQEQLRRARTMEAMGSLVAGVAHEVRNPLFSISATLDALDGEFGPRPEFAEYAGLLRSQVSRLTQLMRDLLDYGKGSVLHRGPARLRDVVRRAVRSCGSLARERKVEVEAAIDEDVPALDVDGGRVEQAFQNLVANAMQHAPEGSTVRVRGAREVREGGVFARCTIDDDGPGLRAEDVGRVFEPFFSRRKGGTGLGLSIVQRVIEAHGGEVTVENRPGGGARFTVLLPTGVEGRAQEREGADA